jgi:hypothetical protein
VLAFVDRAAAAQGFRRSGAPEPVRLWSLSAVLRVPVLRDGTAGDLWFKATCDGFHGEPALTAAVEMEPWLAEQVRELWVLGLPDAVAR